MKKVILFASVALLLSACGGGGGGYGTNGSATGSASSASPTAVAIGSGDTFSSAVLVVVNSSANSTVDGNDVALVNSDTYASATFPEDTVPDII
jgi:hypothetical protein